MAETHPAPVGSAERAGSRSPDAAHIPANGTCLRGNVTLFYMGGTHWFGLLRTKSDVREKSGVGTGGLTPVERIPLSRQ